MVLMQWHVTILLVCELNLKRRSGLPLGHKATFTLSRIGGRTAPNQISRMVRGCPADLGHFCLAVTLPLTRHGPATDVKPG